MRERLIGGKADGMPDSMFDKEQMKAGMEVESEHTYRKSEQKEIFKDHAVETDIDPRPEKVDTLYYDEDQGLPEMEERITGEQSDRYVVDDESDVFVAVTGDEKVKVGIRTADGGYMLHDVPVDDRPVDRPIRVRSYEKESGTHVSQHYRSR